MNSQKKIVEYILFCLPGFLTFINCYDVKLTTRLQNIFMFAKIAALVVIIIAGITYVILGKCCYINTEVHIKLGDI